MTPFQKRILILLTVVIGLTRLLAVARTLFDWDEALFSMGVQEYDVSLHHPHPPGYPLFIAAAKLVHLCGIPEFRSLQVIVVLGALCIFPALFFLAREIGFEFSTSVCGAAIFAFLPNVWIYGGTGFSDVPATALGFGACTLLLRGRRHSRAYLLGAILLGVAAGIRPPNLLIGLIPALLATWHRLKARTFGAVAGAVLLGALVVGGSYLGAALASSSIDDYRSAVVAQGKWVRDVDSWHNPGRPPLRDVAKTFFLYPVDERIQMGALAFFALVSLATSIVKRQGAPLLTLAIFGPLAIAAWLNLDVNTAARYAISYMAIHALLAADGFARIAPAVLSRRVQGALTAALILVFCVWLWPALETQRTTDAPPAGALNWIERNVSPTSTLYVHGAFGPHAAFLLPKHKVTFFETTNEISMMSGEAWVVDWRLTPDGMNFVRPRNTLWKVLRQRNFETSVSRQATLIRFEEGWYQEEGDGASVFRWMSREGRATLPVLAGNGRLSLRMYAPLDAIQPPPAIDVYVNGSLLEHIVPAVADIERSWVVPSRKDAPNEVRILTSATVNPSRAGNSTDTRELGLRIDALTWTSVR